MGKVKTLKDKELVGGSTENAIYPITHFQAVFNNEGINLEEFLDGFTVGDIKSIESNQLDSLKNPTTDCGIYKVKSSSGGNIVVGILQVASDYGAHTIYQRIYTNLNLKDDPTGGEHTDEKEYCWERRYYNRQGTFPEDLIGTWSDWEDSKDLSSRWEIIKFNSILDGIISVQPQGSSVPATETNTYFYGSSFIFKGNDDEYYSTAKGAEKWNDTSTNKARKDTFFIDSSGKLFTFNSDSLASVALVDVNKSYVDQELNKKQDKGDYITSEELQNIIPYIGDNGNWFIQGKDTGKPSRGETGVNLGDVALEQSLSTEEGSENKVISQKAVSNILETIVNILLNVYPTVRFNSILDSFINVQSGSISSVTPEDVYFYNGSFVFKGTDGKYYSNAFNAEEWNESIGKAKINTYYISSEYKQYLYNGNTLVQLT